MKITLLTTGKTDQDYLKSGIEIYQKRLKHYIPFEIKEIPALKKTSGMNVESILRRESEMLEKYLAKADQVILLDENGKHMDSVGFSGFLQQKMNASYREVLFVVGGAWGFHQNTVERSHGKISLSKMTFSHQMIRLFFVEQLYRAFTILKGESYHNL